MQKKGDARELPQDLSRVRGKCVFRFKTVELNRVPGC